MTTPQAFIAVNRFGFGAMPGDLATAAADPRGWLLSQLNPAYARPPALQNLPTTKQAYQSLKGTLGNLRDMKKGKEGAEAEIAKRLIKGARGELKDGYIAEISARVRLASETKAPFFERLVHFWSNHFTVSAQKLQILPLVAAFERDAIRPHILGKFEDMLLASSRHPAMLMYLDNARSIGPGSKMGQRRGKGLNENLAREILELHTLGVNGGYSQDDVIALARMLTGWTVDALNMGDGSGFLFAPRMHEPGAKSFLGMTYRDAGEKEAETALRDISIHPSTARFIATKLARHFISDDPPPAAVNTLAASYLKNGGYLPAVYDTLISLDACWQDPLAKVKTPNDYILSVLRATQLDAPDLLMVGAFKTLGQTPFSAASPQGWSDEAKDWIGAEALLQRVDFARKISQGISSGKRPKDLMEETIGPLASPETRKAVFAAGSAAEGFTLLFASSEFQRR